MADYLHRLRAASERRNQIKRDRNGAAHIHIALKWLKALGVDRNAVRIRRQIVEHVPSCRICRGRSTEARHWIRDLHLDSLHHAAGRILHGPLNRSRQTLATPPYLERIPVRHREEVVVVPVHQIASAEHHHETDATRLAILTSVRSDEKQGSGDR